MMTIYTHKQLKEPSRSQLEKMAELGAEFAKITIYGTAICMNKMACYSLDRMGNIKFQSRRVK